MYHSCAYPNCATPVTSCEIHHIQTGLDPAGGTLTGPGRWRFVSPTGQPIPDHRKTLERHVEQLTLLADPSDPPDIG
jgi:hypothetical protein